MLSIVAEFLEREGIAYAVVGAFSLHAYGLGRATMDVDLVAEAGARQRILEFLESLGYETLHVSTGYSNHLHPLPAMGRVDLVYVGGDTGRLLFGQCARSLDLAGQIAWVTGSSRGLGRVMAEHLGPLGADLVVHGTTRPRHGLSARPSRSTRWRVTWPRARGAASWPCPPT